MIPKLQIRKRVPSKPTSQNGSPNANQVQVDFSRMPTKDCFYKFPLRKNKALKTSLIKQQMSPRSNHQEQSPRPKTQKSGTVKEVPGRPQTTVQTKWFTGEFADRPLSKRGLNYAYHDIIKKHRQQYQSIQNRNNYNRISHLQKLLKTPSPKNKLKPIGQATGQSDEKDGEITVIKEESMSNENIIEPSKGIVTFELKSRSPMSIGSKNHMGQQTID